MAILNSRFYQPWNGSTFSRSAKRFWVVGCVAVFLLIFGAALHPSSSFITSSPSSDITEDNKNDVDSTKPHVPLKVWEAPDWGEDPVVQKIKTSDGLKQAAAVHLEPFPITLMEGGEKDHSHRPWLAAVICSADNVARRQLIRYSWMNLAKNGSIPMDQRFVMAAPGPAWTEIIRQENRTFGDIIVLDNIPEDRFTANTIKTIEFYRWVLEKSPKKYEFISKIDTDLYLNARLMWDRFLRPRLTEKKSFMATHPTYKANVTNTVISQFAYADQIKLAFASGAFYTMTWDLMELLVKLEDKHRIIIGEDVLVASLLLKEQHKVNFVHLSQSEKFEFEPKDTRKGVYAGWAQKGTDPTTLWHALANHDAIAIHSLKTEEKWLRIAECFDVDGVKEIPVDEGEPLAGDERPVYPRPWSHRIPLDQFEVDADGRTLVHGIWKLGPGQTREDIL